MLRLIGNTIHVTPVHKQSVTPSGIVAPNHYNKQELTYRVVAVGPGAWEKRGKSRVFIKPEVQPGDLVLTKAALNQDECLHHFQDDCKGDMIIKSSACLATWRE